MLFRLVLFLLLCSTSMAQLQPWSRIITSQQKQTATHSYIPGGIYYDGTAWNFVNQAVIPDTKAITLSFWLKMASESSDTTEYKILAISQATTTKLYLRRLSSGILRILCYNSSSGAVLDSSTTATVRKTNGWCHIYLTCDMTSGTNYGWCINGIPDTTVPLTYNDDTMDLSTSTPYFIVGNLNYKTASGPIYGSLAEIWICNSYLGTNSNTAFYNNGKPIVLPSNGLAVGVIPQVYLSTEINTTNAWYSNKGSVAFTSTSTNVISADATPISR